MVSAVAVGSPSARAVDSPPPPPEALEWVREVTRVTPGPYRSLRPVKVDFGLSWNNVLNAGELAVEVREAEPVGSSPQVEWIGHAEGRSNGLARALWPYDVEAQSRIDRASLRPRLFELSETEREKSYRYRLMFEPARLRTQTVTMTTKVGRGETPPEPTVKESTYRYEFVHDILSTALYLRSHELAKGDSIKTIVSPFNRPYYAEFEAIGREDRKVKGETYPTIRLDVDIRKINFDRTLQDYDKMKTATIWLSDDEFRLPVEIHADIFVGFVSARVTRREWLDGGTTPASGTPAPAKDPSKPKDASKAKGDRAGSAPVEEADPAPAKPGFLKRLLGRDAGE